RQPSPASRRASVNLPSSAAAPARAGRLVIASPSSSGRPMRASASSPSRCSWPRPSAPSTPSSRARARRAWPRTLSARAAPSDSRHPPLLGAVALAPCPARDRSTELVGTPDASLGVVAIALLVASALGAFHALEPGHGKTVVAAYLVGSRGTARHALILGLIVTASHTAGVYLLGGITFYASRHVVPERLYPSLGL